MPHGWEDRAHDWIAWARTSRHDAYWRYRPQFDALVPQAPPDGGNAVDIACGEGRTTRDLTALGWHTTGLDASPTLIRIAAEADPTGTYVVAHAEQLPFADGSFDLVSIYNALMDVDDMPRAVAEAARVLVPAGHLCACVTHPTADAGRWTDAGTFELTEPYLESADFEASLTHDGLSMTFSGTRHPLHAYTAALESVGLAIEALREPPPKEADEHYEPWQRVPMFLMLRAVKLAGHAA